MAQALRPGHPYTVLHDGVTIRLDGDQIFIRQLARRRRSARARPADGPARPALPQRTPLQDPPIDDVRTVTDVIGVRTVLDLRYREEAAAEGSGLLGAPTSSTTTSRSRAGGEGPPGTPCPPRPDGYLVGFYLSTKVFSGPTVARALALPGRGDPQPGHAALRGRQGPRRRLRRAGPSRRGRPRPGDRPGLRTETAVLTRLRRDAHLRRGPERTASRSQSHRPGETMIGFLTGVRARYGSVPGYLADVGADAGRPRRPTGLPGGLSRSLPASPGAPESRAGAGQVAGAMPAWGAGPGPASQDDAAAACACR